MPLGRLAPLGGGEGGKEGGRGGRKGRREGRRGDQYKLRKSADHNIDPQGRKLEEPCNGCTSCQSACGPALKACSPALKACGHALKAHSVLKNTYMVVRRCRSTEMVWQVECSSTRAVDSVASFTTPMYPGKCSQRCQHGGRNARPPSGRVLPL